MTIQRAIIVVLCGAVVAGLAFGFSKSQDKQYNATALLLFGDQRPEFGILAPGTSQGDTGDERAPDTNAAVVGSQDTIRAAARALSLPFSMVEDDVKVEAERGTDVVTISAQADSPRAAARLANGFATAFRNRQRKYDRDRAMAARRSVERDLAALSSSDTESDSDESQRLRNQVAALNALEETGSGSPRLVQEAVADPDDYSPNVVRNVAFGGGFGIVVGIAVTALLAGERRRRNPSQAADGEPEASRS